MAFTGIKSKSETCENSASGLAKSLSELKERQVKSNIYRTLFKHFPAMTQEQGIDATNELYKLLK